MEENVDSQMETDVSSTTQDILPAEMPGSTTTTVAETIVDVIELKDDDQDESIDSNTPESKQPVEKTTPTKSPTEERIQRTPVKDTLPVSVKTPEKNIRTPIKIMQDPVLQPVDTGLSKSNMDLEESSIIIDSTAINTVQTVKTPEKIKTVVENIQNSGEIKTKTPEKIQTTPEIVQTVEKVKSPEKKQKSPEKVPETSNKVEPENETDANMSSQHEAPAESGDHENDDRDKDEVVVFVPIDVRSETISNDSQETLASVSETASEKDHNKSISRELKSLIASAKESKIISECTQLTTKTRKSRQLLDSSNSSLNTSVDADKIQGHRRESCNSQKSSCSEKSEKANLKRSMRSQNPEFVTKNKQFLNTVNAKHSKEEADTEEPSEDSKKKESLNDSAPSTPKKKKMEEKQPPPLPPVLNSNKLRSDPYCWRCHWIEDDQDEKNPPAKCTVCPRTFHFKCLSGPERTKLSLEKNWVCPKCITILHAESSETRSPVMKKVKPGMLCDLLKYALKRMTELNGVEPFLTPVDRTTFPDYDKYVVHAVDLQLVRDSIAAGVYGSTEAFVSDAQWILHNSIIFNTLQSKLTAAARALVRCCRAEMSEIEACPECYAGAHSRRPTWFTDVCSTPHVLLWAKLKGSL
ncbi:hypothetical protein JYU34_011267 [Plutella xylostella]|uniref:Uncharacterized protein n=1 Tax=Plutella xylostella TaxID=51655 RepID=A0ABQ7QK51_PLUXY|nr:hypothetical protein JYU34_011267 [Plutella xylostella]